MAAGDSDRNFFIHGQSRSLLLPARLSWLVCFTGVILILGYVLINGFESEIASFYSRLFPEKKYHSQEYWTYLTESYFFEFATVCIYFVATFFMVERVNIGAALSKTEHVLLRKTSLTLHVTVAAVFLLTTVVAFLVLQEFPNSADEYAYVFQAESLSRGVLWDTPHPLRDFFEFEHIAEFQNKWLSRFPPGWPLMLSVAFILGVPAALVNPVLGAVTLYVFFAFCKRRYNERTAIWATLISALSGSFIYNSASFFSHTSSLLCLLLFIHFFYIHLDNRRWQTAVLAGFFLGLLAITRYFTAFLIFMPVFGYLVYHSRLRSLPTLIATGFGALPPVLYLLWYNYVITGNPLLPVTMWAYQDESLGFVNGHSVVKGVEFLLRRLFLFITWVSPGLIVLYAVYLWRKLADRTGRWLNPEDYWFVLLIAGYFFYYHFGGNQYGPRFYYEAIPFLVIFVTHQVLNSRSRWSYALLFTGLVYAVVKLPLISDQEHRVVVQRKDVYTKVEEGGISNAVVLIGEGTGPMRPMSRKELARNDKGYKNDVLYAIDQKERNALLLKYYRNRTFYYYVREEDEASGRLIRVSDTRELISGAEGVMD